MSLDIQPIFLKPEVKLDSYQDFWKLVELSGFQVKKIEEASLAENDVYIVTPFTPEIERALLNCVPRNREAFVIWWNLERPDHISMEKETPQSVVRSVTDYGLSRGVDRVWISDLSIAALDRRLIYAMVGGHAGLKEPAGEGPAYDLSHMCYAWGRREHLLNILSGKGLKIAPASWGVERATTLHHSKAVLNMHQREPLKVTAPLRFALAAAYGKPIFTETVERPEPFEEYKSILMADFEKLPMAVPEWLKREDLLEIGERGRILLTETHTFRKEVEKAMIRTFRPGEMPW